MLYIPLGKMKVVGWKMNEKEKILESWIMVEHLSEGDIKVKDKSILTFFNLKNNDFYCLLSNEIEKKKFRKGQQGGVVLYFEIFPFAQVVSILREVYNLKPTNEEIHTGDKFSFALYFDKELNLKKDMTFLQKVPMYVISGRFHTNKNL